LSGVKIFLFALFLWDIADEFNLLSGSLKYV